MLSDNETRPFSVDDMDSDDFRPQPIGVMSNDDEIDDDHDNAYMDYADQDTGLRGRGKTKLIVGCAIAGGVLAAILGSTMCHSNAPSQDTAIVTTAPTTVAVERTDFEKVTTIDGKVTADSSYSVTADVDGVVASVEVSEGQEVNAGDVLMTLNNERLSTGVTEAEQAVERSQAVVDDADRAASEARAYRDESWDTYNAEYTHYTEAYESYQNTVAAASVMNRPVAPDDIDEATATDEERAIHQQELDIYGHEMAIYQTVLAAAQTDVAPEPPAPLDDTELLRNVNSTEQTLAAAREGLQAAQEELNKARTEDEKRTVKSQASGTVVSIDAPVGTSIKGQPEDPDSEVEADTLITISNLRSMGIEAHVSAAEAAGIKRNQWAKVTFPGVDGLEVDARVDEVALSGGEDGGYTVTLTVPLPDERMQPSMDATIKVYTIDLSQSLVVPLEAITENGDGTAVVKVLVDKETNEVEERTVKVNAKDETRAAISDGVKEGDLVVVD